jgi:hypothetical protein
VFWSLNRWYVDPFWNPHFYYGVTWFPRNYYSALYRHWYRPGVALGWYGRPWHVYLAYSPYRYSWIDHYYDWYPWYVSYPHYHRFYTPRYGNPRNEAERLSRYSAAYRGGGLPADQLDRYSAFSRAARSQALVEARRTAWRGADYGSDAGRGRIDPQVSGFRQDGAARSTLPSRGSAGGSRQDPRVSGFRTPASAAPARPLPSRSASEQPRRWDEAGVAYPYRGDVSRQRRTVTEREAPGGVRLPAERLRSAPQPDGHALDPLPRRSERTPAAPLPSTRYQVPRALPADVVAAGGAVTPSRRSAATRPAARYETPDRMAPRYETPRHEAPRRQVPRYETPRYEALRHQAPRYEAPRYQAPRRESTPLSAQAAREPAAPPVREESRSTRAERDEE